MQLLWAWRANAPAVTVPLLPFPVLALLYLVLFDLTGIFSSEVIKAACNETLATTSFCRAWLAEDSNMVQGISA